MQQVFKLRCMKPIKTKAVKTMKRHIAVLLMLGMLPWTGLHAQKTTTFRVAATVEEFCDVTAPDLALGNYTARRGAPLRPTQLLRATCTPDTTYRVGLNNGTWIGTDTVTGVGTGGAVDHTLFDAGPATQVIAPGDYTDTVTVRVYY
jgi:spore coat protein U-like protein